MLTSPLKGTNALILAKEELFHALAGYAWDSHFM